MREHETGTCWAQMLGQEEGSHLQTSLDLRSEPEASQLHGGGRWLAMLAQLDLAGYMPQKSSRSWPRR